MGALADRRFRRLLVGTAVSSFGDSALYLSLGIWAKDLTNSNAAAGGVFLAMGLASLTAPLGGHLADRVRRRRLLIVANTLTGAMVMSLLAVNGRGQLWVIYAVAFAYGASRGVIGPASAGLIRDLLVEGDLTGANASLQTVGQGLRIASPAAGAALFAWLGGGSLAVLDAATFVAVIAAYASIEVPESEPAAGGDRRLIAALLEGAIHLRATRLLAQLNASYAVAMLVLGFYESVTFAVLSAIRQPPSFFGVLMSVQAAGSILGGLACTRLIGRLGEARGLGVALLLWVTATTIYTIPTLATAFVALVIFGAAIPLAWVSVVTANQRLTPPQLQGRVTAASNMLLDLAQTLSIALGAALVDRLGYEPLLGTAAVVVAVPAAVLFARPAGSPSPPLISHVRN